MLFEPLDLVGAGEIVGGTALFEALGDLELLAVLGVLAVGLSVQRPHSFVGLHCSVFIPIGSLSPQQQASPVEQASGYNTLH